MSNTVGFVEIKVVAKSSGLTRGGLPVDFRLEEASVVQIRVDRTDVQEISRAGNDLLVKLVGGHVVTVRNFFGSLDAGESQLVLDEGAGGLWLAQIGSGEVVPPISFSIIASIDPFLWEGDDPWRLPVLLGGSAGLGALAAVGGGGGGGGGVDSGSGNGSGSGSGSASDGREPGEHSKPVAPIVDPINGTANITGIAEPGATVVVTFPDGSSALALVDEEGHFSLASPGFKDGDKLTLVVVGDQGSSSPPTNAIVDAIAPDVSELAIVINAVTDDNIINADEAAERVTLSGSISGAPLDAVHTHVAVTIDGVEYTANLVAGLWSVSVPGAALVADVDQTFEVTVIFTDAAGNQSAVNARHDYMVDTVAPDTSDVQITIDPITGDYIVNSVEAAEPVTLTGQLVGLPTDAVHTVVIVTIDGVAYTATLADSQWSVSVPGFAMVADVDHVLEVTAIFTDAAGNQSEVDASYGYIVDINAPDTSGVQIIIDPITGDNVINADEAVERVTLTGSLTGVPADADFSVIARIGDVDHIVSVKPDGTWSVKVPGADLLNALPSTVKVIAIFTDAAGNQSEINASKDYGVDTGAPDMADVQITIDPIAGDNIINAAEAEEQVTLTGTLTGVPADAETTGVVVRIADVEHVVKVQADGTWSLTVPGADLVNALPSTVQVIATFTDAAGNQSEINASQDYGVDSTAPETGDMQIHIDAITGDNIVSAAEAAEQVTLTGTLTGAAADAETTVVVVRIGDVEHIVNVQADGTWSLTVPGTDLVNALPSTVQVIATFTDAAGNQSQSKASQDYGVDTAAPDMANVRITIDPVAGDNIVNAAEAEEPVTLAGTLTGAPADAETTVVTVRIGDVDHVVNVNPDGTWSLTVPGADLVNALPTTVQVIATFTDAAGNQSEINVSKDYGVDTVAPDIVDVQITIDAIAGDNIINAAEAEEPVTLTGTLTGVPVDVETKVVIVRIGDEDHVVNVNTDGTWSLTVPGVDLVNALPSTVQVIATFTDAAGNQSETDASQEYAVDIVAPDLAAVQIIIDPITDDNIINAVEAAEQILLTGRLSGVPVDADMVIVNLRIGGVDRVVNLSHDGTWSLNVSGAELASVQPGTVRVTAIFRDAVGNQSEISASRGFSVDTEAPDTSNVRIDIDTITSDNVINAAEAAKKVTLTGTVTGVPADAETMEVIVRIGGVDHVVSVNDDGTWSLKVPGAQLANALPNCVNVIAIFTDVAGNQSEANAIHEYSVDTVAPDTSGVQLTIDPIAGDNIVNDAEARSAVTLTGRLTGEPADAAQTQVIVLIGRKEHSVSVSGDGTWSLKVPGMDLYYAVYRPLEVFAVFKDAVGNQSKVVVSQDYVMATPETPRIVDISDDVFSSSYPSFAGSVQSGGLTNDGTPKINGTGTPGDRISIYDNGTYLGNATVQSNGRWSFEVTKAMILDDGAHCLTATASLWGMTSDNSEAFNFFVDKVGPSLSENSLDVSLHSMTLTEISADQADTNVTIYFNVEMKLTDGDAVYMVPYVVIGNKHYNGKSYAAVDGTQMVEVVVRGSLLLASASSEPSFQIRACLVDEAGNPTDFPGISANYTITPTATLKSVSRPDDFESFEVLSDEVQNTEVLSEPVADGTRSVAGGVAARALLGAENATSFEEPDGRAFADMGHPALGGILIENTVVEGASDIATGIEDTLIHQLLVAADSADSRSPDTINGFSLGSIASDVNVDRIDLSMLLQGYAPSIGGQFAAEYVDGVATIATGDAIENYLKVQVSGNDTLIEIDRSGSGQEYSTILTLTDVQTDLATLLANHQITLV